MIKIIRVRVYPIKENKNYGIDFVASKTKSKNGSTHYRTIERTKEQIDKLENFLINKNWQIIPSLYQGGYWSANIRSD